MCAYFMIFTNYDTPFWNQENVTLIDKCKDKTHEKPGDIDQQSSEKLNGNIDDIDKLGNIVSN